MAEIQYNNMREGFQLTKTDVRVLKFLLGNITREFSINKISEAVEIAYPLVRERVQELNKNGIVNIKEINPTQSSCSINIKNSNNVSIFSYIEFMKKEELFSKKKGLKIITDDILNNITGNSFAMILFGSLVKNKETKASDIDILFLISSASDENKIMSAVATAERLTSRKIHAITMLYNDFFGSLKQNSPIISREVLENHIIIYGAEAFYRSLAVYG